MANEVILKLKDNMKSITLDDGPGFTRFKTIANLLDGVMRIIPAHAYYERGVNKGDNGFIC